MTSKGRILTSTLLLSTVFCTKASEMSRIESIEVLYDHDFEDSPVEEPGYLLEDPASPEASEKSFNDLGKKDSHKTRIRKLGSVIFSNKTTRKPKNFFLNLASLASRLK